MFLIIFVAFISLIGLIVLHEFGHFIVAKRFGVKVEEFGIGYPPRLIGKKFGETIYSLNLLPFGAFVKIYGEERGIESPQAFTQKSIWQRALIILGGVISFWFISVILLSIVSGMGMPTIVSDEENGSLINPRVQILAVVPNSPADLAGLKPGDTIRKFSIFNFQFSINKVKEIQELTKKYAGKEITLTIERGKEIFEVSLVPRLSPPEGEGAMGVVLAKMAMKKYPWPIAPIKGMEACLKTTKAIVIGLAQTLGDLILERRLLPGVQLVGPVGIVSLMTQFAKLGAAYYLQFIAVISIYLAIFNLLPIPALDGGKLLFLTIEAIRKKPVSEKTEKKLTAFFFSLLIFLLIVITIRDIVRLF